MRQFVQGSVSYKNFYFTLVQYDLARTSIVQISNKGSCKTDCSVQLNINKSRWYRIRLTLQQLLIELIQGVQKMFASSSGQDFPR